MEENKYKWVETGDWSVCYMEEIESTNDVAKNFAKCGNKDHTAIVANCQTAGRGRLGRSFLSERGSGIYMSLLLRPDILPVEASMMTLLAGLAVRKAVLELVGLDTQIKWPNDIVCGGRKLCGILTEMAAKPQGIEYVIVGIGLNVCQKHFQDELCKVATSLYMETGRMFERVEIIDKILKCFDEYFQIFLKTHDMSLLKDEYNMAMVNFGKEVCIHRADENYLAVAQGINTAGELLVEHKGVPEKVVSGEVSIRGVYGYV